MMDTYEKKYNDALERARYVLHTVETAGCAMHKDLLTEIFPELRESEDEDERIRKGLIEYLKADWEHHPSQSTRFYASALAYLEKQKQKSTSFNEPYNPDEYEVVMEGNATSLKRKEQKPAWNEEDKKNIESVIDAIYLYYPDPVKKYKLMDWIKQFPPRVFPQNPSILPPKPVEWNQEDIKRLYSIGTQIGFLEGKYSEYQKDIDWLHALAEKMGFHKCKTGEIVIEWKKEDIDDKMLSKPKQEWSEEDKTRLCWIIECFDCWKYQVPEFADQYQSAIDFLKSLRPQPHWKPSEKHVEAVRYFVNKHQSEAWAATSQWKEFTALRELLDILQKLM